MVFRDAVAGRIQLKWRQGGWTEYSVLKRVLTVALTVMGPGYIVTIVFKRHIFSLLCIACR